MNYDAWCNEHPFLVGLVLAAITIILAVPYQMVGE